ncbi:Zinc finger CCHC-type protein [Dioscorea alata]|uniref:Zinc finger CCHC-type protein n=1 Tax=Dioscorea alata TaxID=55571 RepID=A0ACB7ULA5_DIOAL|nr:Zinc finger CCHC-type protein [Dioscorea alata]
MQRDQEPPYHSDEEVQQEEQPDPTSLTDIMREMMLMMRAQRRQHTSAGGRDLLTEFGRYAPPPFAGTTNPTVSGYWISQIERTFRATQSPDEDKVRLASFMLRDSAAQWFKNELHLKRDSSFRTWKQFKEAFHAKYFSMSRRTQMDRQFLSLKQGSMSVEEYEAEFDRLSQFASSLVSDKSSKSRRFVDGLKTHIRRAIVSFIRLTYAEIVDIAKDLEITWLETQDQGRREHQWHRQNPRKSQSSESGSGHSRGECRSQPYSRPPSSSSGSGVRGSSGSAAQEVRCPTCGGPHSQPKCRRATGACYRCGNRNHFVAQCPQSPTRTQRGDGTQSVVVEQPRPSDGSQHMGTSGR